MLIGVNFDGVKVEVDVASSDSVGVAIKKALHTIFSPEASPPVDGCAASLCGEEVSHRDKIEELLQLGEGHVLHVTLPF